MKKYSETEKAVKIAKAQARISEIFRQYFTYSELMETLAEASTFLLSTLNQIANNGSSLDQSGEPSNFSEVVAMVEQYKMILAAIKPFAEVDGQIFGNHWGDD